MTEVYNHEDILEPGDIVKLKDSFEGYQYGIVAEIISRYNSAYQDVEDTIGIDGLIPETGTPRTVALFLFKQSGDTPNTKGDLRLVNPTEGVAVPEFVDFHVRDLILLQKASDSTYTIRNMDIIEYIV